MQKLFSIVLYMWAAPSMAQFSSTLLYDNLQGTTVITSVAPAINDSGNVVFRTDLIFASTTLDLVQLVQNSPADATPYITNTFPGELDNILNLRLANDDTVAFHAERATQDINFPRAFGIYKVQSAGATAAQTRSVVYEQLETFVSSTYPPKIAFDMNQTGQVLYSTIVDGTDAGTYPDAGVFRTETSGPDTKLRSGNGTYFNTGDMALDGAGNAYIQFEYTDQGLQRGVLKFTGPSDTIPLTGLSSLVEKLTVGNQPRVDASENGRTVLSFFSDGASEFFPGNVSVGINAGVYLPTATPIDTQPTLQSLDNGTDPADRFFDVAINDPGLVVYRRQLNGGAMQLMAIDSTDPLASPFEILSVGSVFEGKTVSDFRFGQAGLNDRNQVAVWIDYTNGLTELRRIQVPEPGTVLLLGAGLGAMMIRRKSM